MKLQHRFRSILRQFQSPPQRQKSHTGTIQRSIQCLEPRQVLSAAGGDVLLFSMAGNQTLPGNLNVQAADIVQYDGTDFTIFFQGEDVGLDQPGNNIDALALIGDNQLLLSFYNEVNLAGVGTVGPGDIVLFEADSLGENTAGTFSLFVSASELGLGSNNIDALDLWDDGSLLISTLHDTQIAGIQVDDQDLIQFTPDEFGSFASGTRQLFFDGNATGLDSSNENIDGVSVNGMEVRLSTLRGNSIPRDRIGGSDEDVIAYSATQLGEDTQGRYTGILFDGSAKFVPNLDAFDYAVLSKPSTPPTAQNLLVEVAEDQSFQVQLQGDDADPDVENALTYQIVNGPAEGKISEFDPATGTFTYTPGANYYGDDQLTYLVQERDAQGNLLESEVAVVQIAVTAVNDAPTVLRPQDPLTGKEDVVLDVLGIQFGDIEAESEQQTVAVTVRAKNGTVSFSASQPGVQITGNGTSEIRLIGSIAEINSLLSRGILFRPATNFSGQAMVAVSIFDDLDPNLALSASGGVEVDILSTREQAIAFRDQVFELLESGELRKGPAHQLLKAVQLNGHGKQIEKTIDKIARWEARGQLDSDVAEFLTEQPRICGKGPTRAGLQNWLKSFPALESANFLPAWPD